ncbi:MAG: outer membrane lipoprotein-sorting protein [Sulfurovum sp.]|uniref:outer membrane lipoprotein-sorting protein n=1 Tax=Sulfurovum sp. TaxID=1969726 RepID=UPI002867E9DD|nr:outer membrane lipoprotein-sorting protein [Sulfurovum sp.]MCO4845348.1 outer membrane lipoprotein-sorting protein [Sulfurovum sp.]
MKIIFPLLSLGFATHLMAISNEEISKKAHEATAHYISEKSKVEMLLSNTMGDMNKRNLTIKKLEGNHGDKTLIEFSSPADVKGTILLTHEHLDKNDNQWLYMPGLKKTKRIVSRNKSGSFMGSEFSYEDLSSQHYKKFKYSGNAKSVVINGRKNYKSVRTPVDKNSGYSKEVVWSDSKNFLIQKIEYYDKNGALLKVGSFPKYKKINGIWRALKISMKNVQNGKSTILNWTSQKIKVGLSDKDFSNSIFP